MSAWTDKLLDLFPMAANRWLMDHPGVEWLLWMSLPLLVWTAVYFAFFWVPKEQKEVAALLLEEICDQCGRKVQTDALAYHRARTCPKRPKGYKLAKAFGSGENVDRLGSRRRRKR